MKLQQFNSLNYSIYCEIIAVVITCPPSDHCRQLWIVQIHWHNMVTKQKTIEKENECVGWTTTATTRFMTNNDELVSRQVNNECITFVAGWMNNGRKTSSEVIQIRNCTNNGDNEGLCKIEFPPLLLFQWRSVCHRIHVKKRQYFLIQFFQFSEFYSFLRMGRKS